MKPSGKDKILEATKLLISEKGISQLSVREISKAAGVSTGSIYHHYKNKEELLYEVIDNSLNESNKILKEYNKNKSINYNILDNIIGSFTDRFTKDAENKIQLYLTVLGIEGNDDVKNKIADKYRTWINDITELITLSYKDISVDKAKSLGCILLATIDGLILQSLIGEDIFDINDITSTYNILLKEAIPKIIKDI